MTTTLFSWIPLLLLIALTVGLAFLGRRPTIEEIEAKVLSETKR